MTEVTTPFRTPLFNALAERLELTVLFVAERDPRRSYRLEPEGMRFKYEVLRGAGRSRRGAWIVANVGIRRALSTARPEVMVVGGWNQPAYWQALLWARRRRIPVVTWVESTERDARAGSRLVARLKRSFVGRSRAFIVPGQASAAYLRTLGIEPARIAIAPNAVDLSRFRDRVAALRSEHEADGEQVLFLAVSRLSREKGIDVLLRAFEGLDAQLAIAGDGPERERLRAVAPPNVRFLGQLEQGELPAWYARAHCFVLPSRSEPWGMALNEAAAAGLPLVATEAAGAAWDLLEDGVNGFRVPADDPEALRGALAALVGNEHFRRAAGERSLELARGFTPEAWADAVAELAERLARP